MATDTAAVTTKLVRAVIMAVIVVFACSGDCDSRIVVIVVVDVVVVKWYL